MIRQYKTVFPYENQSLQSNESLPVTLEKYGPLFKYKDSIIQVVHNDLIMNKNAYELGGRCLLNKCLAHDIPYLMFNKFFT